MRRILRVLGSAATVLVVLAALLVGGWFVYSASTGATLVIFRTGSMDPTIPQGALAVSLPISAEEIEIDDVITVEREEGELPVTHRVIEIRESEQSGYREIVMQGDANAQPDLHPYVIDQAREVTFSVPGAGTALTIAQSPLGMGIMIMLVGVLATWAFWPAPRAESKAEVTTE